MYSTLKLQPCLVLLLFLSSSPLALAQPGGFPGPGPPPPPPPPPPPQNMYSLGQSFSPTMAIVMVVLITAFFVLGFFSVYVRQCLDRRYHSVHGGRPTLADPDGGPQWGRRGPVGLDASVIGSFPTFLYSAVKGLKVGKGSLECAVCLNEFEDNETLRLIPKCSHVFHPDCIDAWLASHVTCPVCRANLTPRPGELPFTRVEIGEPDDGSVGLVGRTGEENSENRVAGEVCIPIDVEGSRPVPHETQSHETNLLYPAHENRTIRSWSNGWLLREMLFPRSNSTGHSLVQPGENLDRFTLRLPVEVRSQIMETARMNRTKSSTVFPRVRSTRKGYRRTASVGSWRARNYFNYERFDILDRSEPTDSGVNPVSLPRTVPVWSDVVLGAGENPVSEAPTKNFQRSARSLHLSHTKAEGQDGEGSFDWRRSKSTQVRMVADP